MSRKKNVALKIICDSVSKSKISTDPLNHTIIL
jgi:hypothetical protein